MAATIEFFILAVHVTLMVKGSSEGYYIPQVGYYQPSSYYIPEQLSLDYLLDMGDNPDSYVFDSNIQELDDADGNGAQIKIDPRSSLRTVEPDGRLDLNSIRKVPQTGVTNHGDFDTRENVMLMMRNKGSSPMPNKLSSLVKTASQAGNLSQASVTTSDDFTVMDDVKRSSHLRASSGPARALSVKVSTGRTQILSSRSRTSHRTRLGQRRQALEAREIQ
ncbi:hypothetical protein HDE_04487 [Halotydeus destructor]|nr:hypothetical protein HDE_04487 [Halotydeus destructor]